MNPSNQHLLSKLDEIMGRLKGMEEEFILQMGKYETIGDLEDRIDALEKRIQKLEGGAQ